MPNASDIVQATDELSVALEGTVVYSCPQCGKAGKEDHDKGMYICSNRTCRFKFSKEEADVKVLPSEKPAFPCPQCGKESKEHHGVNERICSSRLCRYTFINA